MATNLFNGFVPQSTPLELSDGPVSMALLGIVHSDPIVIEMSPDSGASWISIKGEWAARGTELRMVGTSLRIKARDAQGSIVMIEQQ